MSKEEIIYKTNNFLVDEFEVEEDDIFPDANLKETLELDSLDYVDLVVSVESNFNAPAWLSCSSQTGLDSIVPMPPSAIYKA